MTTTVATLPRRRKTAVAALAATMLLAVPGLVPSARAQVTPAAHHMNMIQRHPTATGIAAGVATHSILKRRAAYKKAHGQKLNFTEKHPTMAGLAAAIATRHEIKAHTAH